MENMDFYFDYVFFFLFFIPRIVVFLFQVNPSCFPLILYLKSCACHKWTVNKLGDGPLVPFYNKRRLLTESRQKLALKPPANGICTPTAKYLTLF